MSKERANNRAAREREAAIRQAAKGHEQDRQDRIVSMKGTGDVVGKHGGPAITPPTHHKTPKNGPGKPGAGKSAGKSAGAKGATKAAGGKGSGAKGRPTPKQSAAQTKKKATGPVGRPDGPLARRRRFRTRLLVVLLVLINVAAAVIWRDWAVSLAVLIGSAILAPLAAAALLRRK